MIPVAAIKAEAERRSWIEPQVLAVLTLAIDENWEAIPTGFFNALDALQHPTFDPWYQLAQLRRVGPADWQAFKMRLYRNIRQALDLYNGKEIAVPVTRKNVEFAKRIGLDRVGNPYVYGGNWDPFNLSVGTDCSGCVIDICDAVRNGTAMAWTRHGMSTETWRPIEVGQTGTIFNTVCVANPNDFPADAAVKIAIHHGPGGGANSHMWCEVDGVRFESNGDDGCVTGDQARSVYDTSYANDWHYIPGPIVEDGTPPTQDTPPEATDTLYADVSEWQVPVDDSYPYRVLCIRSNDGTYRDKKWATNYPWCKEATDAGKLEFFIVYFVWRPNWQDAVNTLKSQVDQPHPKMAVMLDVESWEGQISGNQSAGINAAFEQIASWLGNRRRVIGYGNTGDLNNLWPQKPDGIRLVVAGYGSNPSYPGKIAHQYTNGTVGAGGLPSGAPPFGNCDMNSADGLSPTAFAAALGISSTTEGPFMALTDAEQKELLEGVRYIKDQLGPGFEVWGVDGDLGKNAQGLRRTFRAGLAALMRKSGVSNG